jgi:hypothetical protein
VRPFAFQQLEFGFLIGPGDGRYLVRSQPDGPPEHVLVLTTLGAPERRRFRDRKGRSVEAADPEPVPTNRATVVAPEPFAGEEEAAQWLSGLRDDPDRAEAELDSALGVLARAVRAYRAARAEPSIRDLSLAQALVIRVGYGDGQAVVDGRYSEAWELPRERGRTKRSMESPDERFAALIGGRETILPCEELVLRARADVEASRMREGALQARIALESLLAELGEELAATRRTQLEDDRVTVAEAANAALRGELSQPLADGVDASVQRMEAALAARRLQG